MNADLILLCIGGHLANGMDMREAILEVGEEEVQAATFQGEGIATNSRKRLLECLAVKGRMDRDDNDMEQALELTEAGWIVEESEYLMRTKPKNIWEKPAVMSWKWRRPSLSSGKPGRLFLSTNQAWRAMKRELQAS